MGTGAVGTVPAVSMHLSWPAAGLGAGTLPEEAASWEAWARRRRPGRPRRPPGASGSEAAGVVPRRAARWVLRSRLRQESWAPACPAPSLSARRPFLTLGGAGCCLPAAESPSPPPRVTQSGLGVACDLSQC